MKKNKVNHFAFYQMIVLCGMLLFTSCNGSNAINKEKVIKQESNIETQSDVAIKEEIVKFSAENMVGVWDYYAESDPDNKIEIVFKKDGTLIDFIDFHSTGTYKVNPDGTIITMQFFYNDGSQSLQSKPFEYKVLEYGKERLKIILNGKKGNAIIYDRKAKSDNYNGEL